MNDIVSVHWLHEHLRDDNVAVADCRFELGHPDNGRLAYDRSHIPGAVYIDLERDMSGPVREHGGRHPLPDLGTFSLRMGELGIGNDTVVVAYDDQGGMMASRLWWMLRFLGHRNVYVLDGGFKAWVEAGYESDRQPARRRPKHFSPRVHTGMMISVQELRNRLGENGLVLIDSREASRYKGDSEPIDKRAGHIPGAVNRFWKDGLDEHGRWKPADQQAERFRDIPRDAEIVVYCGSGVSACPNVLALKAAGYERVRLYLGSWSDWISYPDNPIARGES
mgnify:FL=1